MAGVNIVAVPYKGSAANITALLSGEVQLGFSLPSLVAPHLKSGKLRALAVASPEPSALFPGLPTLAATLPGFESAQSTAVLAPAGTPRAIIHRLNLEIARFVQSADVKEMLLSTGSEAVGSSPEQLAAAMKSEMARLGKVIKDAGIKVE
jgi:tripartite-type tricarboxylate transporter receptor subunit TctC